MVFARFLEPLSHVLMPDRRVKRPRRDAEHAAAVAGRRRAARLSHAERLESRLQLSATVLTPMLDARSDTGARDQVTAVTAPVFSGRVAQGTTATLAVTNADTGDTSTFAAVTKKNGSWRVAVPRSSPLAEGRYLVKAIQLSGGVAAGESADLEIRIVTRPPAVTSFTFDLVSFSSTLRFDQVVKGVSLKNFSISGGSLPGSISLADKRVKPLGVTISPSSTAAGDTFVVSIANSEYVDAGRYTLRFDPSRTKISAFETAVKASGQVREVLAEV